MKVLLCRIEVPINLKCAGERLRSGERGRHTPGDTKHRTEQQYMRLQYLRGL